MKIVEKNVNDFCENLEEISALSVGYGLQSLGLVLLSRPQMSGEIEKPFLRNFYHIIDPSDTNHNAIFPGRFPNIPSQFLNKKMYGLILIKL